MVSTRAADVVRVASGAGEHQRIEDDVLGGMPYFSVSSVKSAGDRQFALAGEACPAPVLVDAADHQRGAVARASGHDRSKRSSPSSRLIELMIALPWQHFRPAP